MHTHLTTWVHSYKLWCGCTVQYTKNTDPTPSLYLQNIKRMMNLNPINKRKNSN